MKIIDVSEYQGNIDWAKAAKEVDFVIMRASILQRKDNKYQRNVDALEQLNIPYHAYHYIKATTLDEARDEAKAFAEATKDSKPVFYIIDAEWSGIAASIAKDVIEEFEAELRRSVKHDIRVAVYIGHDKYKSWALNYDRYAYVWIPRYGKNNGTVEGATKPSYTCDLWQYTSKGKVDGIKGNVDVSVLNGNKPLSFFLTGEGAYMNNNTILQKGSKGREVKHLQSVLMALGYDLGKYGADGSYGNLTVAAVKSFQKDHGFQQTGTVTELLYDEMFVALVKNCAK